MEQRYVGEILVRRGALTPEGLEQALTVAREKSSKLTDVLLATRVVEESRLIRALAEEMGLTFSGALRSILRQDPDIVLVGETRDNETADIAVKAALTGHLVMTTLHTNDAPGAVARLAYMGIPNFLIASSLLLSQAQRLVRRICPNCKEEFPLSKEYLKASHIPLDAFEGAPVYHGRGCGKCNNTGYKGRASIMEILPVSSRIREVVLKSANADDIRRVALEDGFTDLRAHGFIRIKEGITTIEEVLSVTSGEA